MSCECRNCQEARMLTALTIVSTEGDEGVVESAQLLLHAWEGLVDGGIDRMSARLPPAEAAAMTNCLNWIRVNMHTMVFVPQNVAVSGYID